MKKKKLNYWQIELDAPDKCGKTSLMKMIWAFSGYNLMIRDRGWISMSAYSEIYGRRLKYSKENNNTIYVLLTCDKKEWEIRCKMNDETPIDYETHVKTFKKYYDKLDAPKLIINTSENTMYKCCIKILKYVEKVNNLEGMFNLAKE